MSGHKQRSRAYPGVTLGVACGLLRERLRDMGSERVNRKALAERLGYQTGEGGVAARKIAALTHLGFLERSEGGFRLSDVGRNLQGLAEDSPEFLEAVRQALLQPVLFKEILRRFQPSGRVPRAELRKVLTSELGITEQAKEEVAEIFLESAKFAGVLRSDGSFADLELADGVTEVKVSPEMKRLEILLAGRRSAWLEFPTDLDHAAMNAFTDALPVVLAQVRTYLQLEEVPPLRGRSTLRFRAASDPPKE